MTLNGIDVSSWQGPAFDWAAWRGKISFAGVKVSEGLAVADPDGPRNVTGARGIGAVPMAYHFLRANLPGTSQARYFLDRAHAAGIGPGDLLMIDVETSDGMTAGQVSACAGSFAAEVHALTGAWPVAYTMQSFAGDGHTASLGNCPAFIANPSRVTLPSPIGPWHVVPFEQVSQRGTDLDVFHGTPAQLAALAWPHPAPAPAPADWTFGAVRGLTAKAGPHSVALTWSAPAAPMPAGIACYEVTVRRNGQDVASYPRQVPKEPNPQTWQGGSLIPGTAYEALVRAVAAGGAHASAWASVAFTTPAG